MKFYLLIFALSVAALVAAIDSCSEAVIKNVIKFLFFIVNKLQAQSAALLTVHSGYKQYVIRETTAISLDGFFCSLLFGFAAFSHLSYFEKYLAVFTRLQQQQQHEPLSKLGCLRCSFDLSLSLLFSLRCWLQTMGVRKWSQTNLQSRV